MYSLYVDTLSELQLSNTEVNEYDNVSISLSIFFFFFLFYGPQEQIEMIYSLLKEN